MNFSAAAAANLRFAEQREQWVRELFNDIFFRLLLVFRHEEKKVKKGSPRFCSVRWAVYSAKPNLGEKPPGKRGGKELSGEFSMQISSKRET